MTNIKKCALCDKERSLMESHVIPKFVFRWLKKTGGPYLRKADNPNMRVEDGIKIKLLCNDCEQLFSKLEDNFARNIFYPYSDKKTTSFYFDSGLIEFSISVLYRILLFHNKENYIFNELHSDDLSETLLEWKGFLLNKKKLEKFDKVHVFFTSEDFNINVIPTERFLNYYLRGVDGAIASNNETCFVYAKMARIILVGEIKNFDNSEMENTLISLQEGEIDTTKMKLNHQVREFLINRIKQLNSFLDKVSDKQKNIALKNTKDFILNNPNSDISKISKKEYDAMIDESLNDFQ